MRNLTKYTFVPMGNQRQIPAYSDSENRDKDGRMSHEVSQNMAMNTNNIMACCDSGICL